jgi:galacturan 1,4-alpha-galacturonidase
MGILINYIYIYIYIYVDDLMQAFMKTWVDACESSSGAVKVLIPDGTYVSGPVTFKGPCKGSSITFEVQGTIKATTDLSDYSGPDWFLFEYINNFVFTGGGTFDGQGEASWKYNDCKGNSNCQLLASVSAYMHAT